ncbi:MAG: sigma-54-dependent Fis family transcriptional regulator [Acidobacteria bacterium]|nr:MAG: sigma-54-dependent Fis family transcriptional regulator [Acidobacteriota bacterium]
MATILIVEDEPKMLRLLELNLADDGYAIRTATTAENGLKVLASDRIDLVLSDVKLPGMSGLEFLQAVKRANASIPVVMMTAYGTVETAVEAMKDGASDFVLKPFSIEEIKLIVRKELEVRRLQEENRQLKEALGHRYQFDNIVANSPGMQEILAAVEQVAPTNATVLLGGESGVGKDMIARAIHQHSRRVNGPFIKINCTAIPENLLESELFGYEKGAFTGAIAAKPGKFELADKGTIFLDEIGDMPGSLQVKLLRVLQEREFERLGATKTIKVDVRVVAATNQDLRAALEQGTFREDLYYRLNVVPISIPPLREHKEDIPYLVDHFIKRFSESSGKTIEGITPEAMKLLVDFHWPGNVRELENIIERALVMTTGPRVGVGDIRLDIARPSGSRPGLDAPAVAANGSVVPLLPEGLTLEQFEDKLIQEALQRAGGNKSQAARLLGLSRNALRYRLSKIGVPDQQES